MTNNNLKNIALGAPENIEGKIGNNFYGLSVQVASCLKEITLHDDFIDPCEEFTLDDITFIVDATVDGIYKGNDRSSIFTYSQNYSTTLSLTAKKNESPLPITLTDVSWHIKKIKGNGTVFFVDNILSVEGDALIEIEGWYLNLKIYETYFFNLTLYPLALVPIIEEHPTLVPIIEEHPTLVPIIEEHPTLASIVMENPALVPIIVEWPSVVNSIIDTGKKNILKSDGIAFIDTGITWALANFNVEAELYMKHPGAGGFVWGTGAWNGSSLILQTNGTTNFTWCNQNVGMIITCPTNTWIKLELGKGWYIANGGNKITASTGSQSNNSNANIRIFGYCSGHVVSVEMEYFKMKVDGNLYRDFVPYIKKDGRIGMLDLVSLQFFGNANNYGTFTLITEPK